MNIIKIAHGKCWKENFNSSFSICLSYPEIFSLLDSLQWILISISQTNSVVPLALTDMVLLQEERKSTKSIPKWAFAGRSEKFTSELRLDENFYNVINRHIKTLDLPSSQSRRHCRASENYSRYARGGKCLVDIAGGRSNWCS